LQDEFLTSFAENHSLFFKKRGIPWFLYKK